MKLSNVQKIMVLIVVLLAIIAGAVFFVMSANKNAAQKAATSTTQIPAQNTNPTPATTATPSPEIAKNYNQVVKDITAKSTAGTATSSDLVDLGVAYYNLGSLTKAIDAYNQAITKDPNNARAYGNVGNIYRDQSEFDKAVQSYKTAIQLDSKNSKFYIGLAFLYNSLMNDKQSAISTLNQGLAAIPSDPDMTALLADYSK